jgi:hypothetical protein
MRRCAQEVARAAVRIEQLIFDPLFAREITSGETTASMTQRPGIMRASIGAADW